MKQVVINPKDLYESLNYTQRDIKNVLLDLTNFGYAKIDKVLPAETCSSLSAMFDEIRLLRDEVLDNPHTEDTREEKSFVEATGQILMRDIIFQRPDFLLPFINLPPVMQVMSNILDDVVILDAHSASNSYRRDPRYRHPPKVHVDSHIAIKEVSQTTHVLVMICLDDFTAGNGGTRVWPGSHKSGVLVHKTPGFADEELPGQLEIHAAKGSMLFMLGQTWHQIGTNIDNSNRWALVFVYTRWWVKPQTDYTQCGEDIFNRCNTEQKALLGFSSRPPKNTMIRHKTLVDPALIPDNYNDAIAR